MLKVDSRSFNIVQLFTTAGNRTLVSSFCCMDFCFLFLGLAQLLLWIALLPEEARHLGMILQGTLHRCTFENSGLIEAAAAN